MNGLAHFTFVLTLSLDLQIVLTRTGLSCLIWSMELLMHLAGILAAIR